MRKLKQPKFNDLTRSELANDAKCSSSPTALSQTFLLDRGRVFGTSCVGNKNSRITLYLSLSSSCVSVSSGSLLSLLFPFLPLLAPLPLLLFPLSFCLNLDFSLLQGEMHRKPSLQGGLTCIVNLWQRPQEGHCNETFVNYPGVLSWLRAPVPYERENCHWEQHQGWHPMTMQAHEEGAMIQVTQSQGQTLNPEFLRALPGDSFTFITLWGTCLSSVCLPIWLGDAGHKDCVCPVSHCPFRP